ncbi:aldo/keto reductase [Rhizobium leguminosarum]|uniref:aldo/keto reductase n=1 Tax=Rhizobium leguminosarum TaxID=384 RepID=UPI001C982F29|nr:aldo/keto reductase [Rhizobium leguminosarum]MBY5422312.1 aldo/keto reductase [Rhizobium leguminosarum]
MPIHPSALSRIALGTALWPLQSDVRTATSILSRGLEVRINVVDTAPSYFPPLEGDSERILGSALKGLRHEFFVVTKVSPSSGGRLGLAIGGLSGPNFVTSVNRSLQRLRTDYVDLVVAHGPDFSTPIDETIDAFLALEAQGKVRFFGLCNFPQSAVSQAHRRLQSEGRGPVFLQELLNVLTPLRIHRLRSLLAVSPGAKIMTYAPLAGGVLARSYNRKVPGFPPAGSRASYLGWTEEPSAEPSTLPSLSDDGIDVINRFSLWAHQRDMTFAKAALGWVLSHDFVDTSIVGVNNEWQLSTLFDVQSDIQFNATEMDDLANYLFARG